MSLADLSPDPATSSQVPAHARDPYETLDDLMAVLEAFAPTWPARLPSKEPWKAALL
jgi:hypothetical protein